MTVRIYSEGPSDFAEGAVGKFDPDTWPDGFGWFDLDTKCAKCGRETKGLIDCETM
jgi:hypothetical protein